MLFGLQSISGSSGNGGNLVGGGVSNGGGGGNNRGGNHGKGGKQTDLELFPGFKPAIEVRGLPFFLTFILKLCTPDLIILSVSRD